MIKIRVGQSGSNPGRKLFLGGLMDDFSEECLKIFATAAQFSFHGPVWGHLPPSGKI